MIKSIKQRLEDNETVRVFFIGPLAHPKLIEMVGLAGGYHGVWIDQEHSAIPHQQTETLVLASRAAGLDAFVRLAPTDYATVMRPLETGAGGVMAAQIRTVEQVQQIVEWSFYPPTGNRGLYSGNYEARYGAADPKSQIEAANRNRWLAIQIETLEAVDQVEKIAAVDGVDCLFVGPGDLSAVLGVPGQVTHPKSIAALEKIGAAAQAAAKPWGILARSAEHATTCRELGCRLFSLSGDVDFFNRGIRAVKQAYQDLF